ncbi:hypothetical protein [Flavobacterium gelatinilyticum]|uniref:hypothetical protein n=1 Tax=Flavobacterium gelatinilyticum TaxID=3003260 RepID=UPI002480D3BE|nr:hypothetical protein [Flavobacterium gelatinilyticum]
MGKANNRSKEILKLNLDYFSDFKLLYEEGIRFYANSKDIVFKLNIKKDVFSNVVEIIQTSQGENDIYFFSLWNGYFSVIMTDLTDSHIYSDLPAFIKNWNEGKGWDWDDDAELIDEYDLDWLIITIKEILPKYKNGVYDKLENHFKCFSDLVIFLEFVKNNNFELRICRN